MFGNTQLGDARQSDEEEDGRDFVDGIGADDFGPNAPSVVQQVAQSVQDATGVPAASHMAGVSPYVIYAGVAMLGYWVYSNYVAHE